MNVLRDVIFGLEGRVLEAVQRHQPLTVWELEDVLEAQWGFKNTSRDGVKPLQATVLHLCNMGKLDFTPDRKLRRIGKLA